MPESPSHPEKAAIVVICCDFQFLIKLPRPENVAICCSFPLCNELLLPKMLRFVAVFRFLKNMQTRTKLLKPHTYTIKIIH